MMGMETPSPTAGPTALTPLSGGVRPGRAENGVNRGRDGCHGPPGGSPARPHLFGGHLGNATGRTSGELAPGAPAAPGTDPETRWGNRNVRSLRSCSRGRSPTSTTSSWDSFLLRKIKEFQKKK